MCTQEEERVLPLPLSYPDLTHIHTENSNKENNDKLTQVNRVVWVCDAVGRRLRCVVSELDPINIDLQTILVFKVFFSHKVIFTDIFGFVTSTLLSKKEVAMLNLERA